jgi:hypothetical protein
MKSLPKSKRQYGTAPMPDFIEPRLAKLVSAPGVQAAISNRRTSLLTFFLFDCCG